MPAVTLLLAGFAILLVGALATLLLGGSARSADAARYVGLAAVLGAAACFLTVSAGVLTASGTVVGPLVLWKPAFLKASLSIRVDALSAFFLLVISGLSVAATWYAVGYTRRITTGLAGFYPPLLLFIFGMAGVVVVDDFFAFFVPWEFMALSSYLLVIFHKERAQNLSAGFKYFFITHAGTVALFFGVTLLVSAGGSSFAFEDMARAMPGLMAARPLLAHTALALIVLGFLVKAGAYPFGMWWLPDAHPAAPAPASALLSGAMIKLGLYGILRVSFSILPAGPWLLPWGLVIGAFGTLSLFFGTVAAVVQNDSKRLLAYSSIGQVGYMLLGFGLALGLTERAPALATIALLGGLFHLLNHACFKGLLFLNAGAFETVAGERDLNQLGGLTRLLPVTAACTIVASLSIAGLPPLNGFSSKWLLYQASLWGGRSGNVLFLFFGIAALFISTVTLATYVKFLGCTIWGTPSPAVRQAHRLEEWPWFSPSQVFLALLCVGLGLFPYAGLRVCEVAAALVARTHNLPAVALFTPSALTMQVSDGQALLGLWSPLLAGSILAGAFLFALLIRRVAAAPEREVAVWSCGSLVDLEELRFKSAHYYTPFRRAVRILFPQPHVVWEARRWLVLTRILNPDRWGYEPLVRGTVGLFRWFARSRVGLPQVYPAWNLIGLAVSFVVLFILLR